MCSESLRAWLTLSFTPKIGSKTLRKLAASYAVDNLIALPDREMKLLGFHSAQIEYIKKRADKEVDDCLAWQQKSSSRHIFTLLDKDYPEQLRQINDAPSVLFIDGNRRSLSEPQVAIVGSRNASKPGMESARAFAADLCKKGLVVTSGMALGIDGHAHDGALKAGGETIAVLGSGIDKLYPVKHIALSERIREQGALVSEFRPQVLPRPEYFPRRNRIISGLSLGVLVVEAARKSGSLITARYAAEQGREVFALPGSIHNPHARGGNTLIKEGASLIQSTDEIINEIESLMAWSINNQKELFIHEDENERLPFPELLANVGVEEAISVDILAQRTHIPVHEIMTQLLELELQGHVAAVSGGYIRTRRG